MIIIKIDDQNYSSKVPLSSNQQQYDLACWVGSSSQCLLWAIENNDDEDDDDDDDDE